MTETVHAEAGQRELAWVSRTVHNHSIVVQVSGEVDQLSTGLVDSQLVIAEALVVPPAPVVLDLTTTTFFGSAGLRLLAEHAERCAELGSPLRVVADHRPVLRTLALADLDDAPFDVVPTVARAVAPSLVSPPAARVSAMVSTGDRKADDGHAHQGDRRH